MPRRKDHAGNFLPAFIYSAISRPLSSPLAGLGEEQVLVGAGLWDLDPGDLGSDPSSASVHYATPGKALHLFELPFPQLYTEQQQACRIIMMADLGHRQLKKGAWGGWAHFGPLCWGADSE